MDKARMLAVVRLAIVKHLRDNYLVDSGELAREVVEAVGVEEVEEFERQMIANAETMETPF